MAITPTDIVPANENLEASPETAASPEPEGSLGSEFSTAVENIANNASTKTFISEKEMMAKRIRSVRVFEKLYSTIKNILINRVIEAEMNGLAPSEVDTRYAQYLIFTKHPGKFAALYESKISAGDTAIASMGIDKLRELLQGAAFAKQKAGKSGGEEDLKKLRLHIVDNGEPYYVSEKLGVLDIHKQPFPEKTAAKPAGTTAKGIGGWLRAIFRRR